MRSHIYHLCFSVLFMACATQFVQAQLEDVIIETYYIASADDRTDTTGGALPANAVTYRIFIDLLPGSSLISVYGDENHSLEFGSTAPFFNHKEEGISFGKDLNRNRYAIGTVGLDSYITLGQVSRVFSQSAYMGIPKDHDLDGSIIGGTNNDGGSMQIAGGLLSNTDPAAGIPVTTSDGMAISQRLPGSWVDVGFIDIISDSDTTIFGRPDLTQFTSKRASLRNAGTVGPDTLSNIILLAQLTTAGALHFAINIEVMYYENGVEQRVRYVSTPDNLHPGELFEPLLHYPYTCGCTDPDYLEASSLFACSDNTLCLTPVVFGCMDPLACNYNAAANFNIQEMCCYIGYCQDRDISIVCPSLAPRMLSTQTIRLFPNPAADRIVLESEFPLYHPVSFEIVDLTGRKIMEGVFTGKQMEIMVDQLLPGLYAIHLQDQDDHIVLPFLKM